MENLKKLWKPKIEEIIVSNTEYIGDGQTVVLTGKAADEILDLVLNYRDAELSALKTEIGGLSRRLQHIEAQIVAHRSNPAIIPLPMVTD